MNLHCHFCERTGRFRIYRHHADGLRPDLDSLGEGGTESEAWQVAAQRLYIQMQNIVQMQCAVSRASSPPAFGDRTLA